MPPHFSTQHCLKVVPISEIIVEETLADQHTGRLETPLAHQYTGHFYTVESVEASWVGVDHNNKDSGVAGPFPARNPAPREAQMQGSNSGGLVPQLGHVSQYTQPQLLSLYILHMPPSFSAQYKRLSAVQVVVAFLTLFGSPRAAFVVRNCTAAVGIHHHLLR